MPFDLYVGFSAQLKWSRFIPSMNAGLALPMPMLEITFFLRARAENLRSMFLSMSRGHRTQNVWVALCKLYRPGEPLQLNLFGHHVCRRSWYRAMATGSSGLQNMQKSLLASALGPPQAARWGNIIISKHPERLHDVDRVVFFIGVGQRLPKILRMNVATRRPAAAASATQFWTLTCQSQAVGPSIVPT